MILVFWGNKLQWKGESHMFGGVQYGFAASTGTGIWGIGAVVVGTLILIAIIAVFCTCCM
jgi:hypothetical protein